MSSEKKVSEQHTMSPLHQERTEENNVEVTDGPWG